MAESSEAKAQLVMEIAPGLPKHMKTLRKRQNWSQHELADRLGVHLTHINRVETGKVLPGLDFAVKLARLAGTSLDQILADTEDLSEDIHLENKEFSERLRLLEALDEEERVALYKIMSSMLMKHRIRRALDDQVA